MAKVGRKWVPYLKGRAISPFLCLLFCLGHQETGWLCALHWTWPFSLILLQLSIQIFPEKMFYRLAGHPLAYSNWHIKINFYLSYWVCKMILLLILLLGVENLKKCFCWGLHWMYVLANSLPPGTVTVFEDCVKSLLVRNLYSLICFQTNESEPC